MQQMKRMPGSPVRRPRLCLLVALVAATAAVAEARASRTGALGPELLALEQLYGTMAERSSQKGHPADAELEPLKINLDDSAQGPPEIDDSAQGPPALPKAAVPESRPDIKDVQLLAELSGVEANTTGGFADSLGLQYLRVRLQQALQGEAREKARAEAAQKQSGDLQRRLDAAASAARRAGDEASAAERGLAAAKHSLAEAAQLRQNLTAAVQERDLLRGRLASEARRNRDLVARLGRAEKARVNATEAAETATAIAHNEVQLKATEEAEGQQWRDDRANITADNRVLRLIAQREAVLRSAAERRAALAERRLEVASEAEGVLKTAEGILKAQVGGLQRRLARRGAAR